MFQLVALSLLPWIPVILCKVTTEEAFTVLEGRSLKIPCHYEPQYASYVKYWCQGRTKEFCTSLARTDDLRAIDPAGEKVSIFDDPIQQVFTVTMNHLKEEESGWYVCGIEIGGFWYADDTTFTNIKVIHGMSAVNSRLSGEEGSSVTVECLYSEKYKESEKTWCRTGDWRSCLSTGSEGSYEDSSLAIRDDRSGTFSVTFKKLQMRDTAWYWCSAGQQKIAVHVLVTPRATTTTAVLVTSPPSQSLPNLLPPEPITKESWNTHSLLLATVVVCSSILFLVAMVLLAKKLWNKHKKDPLLRGVGSMAAKFTGFSPDASDLQNSTVVFLNKNSQDMHMI
ncbi:polymeric immunoglobulin receptor [Menidia menidia]